MPTVTSLLASLLLVQTKATPVLSRAHSHNDYAQKRPLDEALDNGFCSVEVDVFPVDGKLLVGHDEKDLKPEKTIESMYLDKLSERVKKNKGTVYADSNARFWVLVDVKREGILTYKLFKAILDKYPELQPGKTNLRFVISGDRAINDIAADKGAYAGIDGRPENLGGNYSVEQMPWISASWFDFFKWNGAGEVSDKDKQTLKEMVANVHREKRLIRFWGMPDYRASWELQCQAKIDLINTDRIVDLCDWFKTQK